MDSPPVSIDDRDRDLFRKAVSGAVKLPQRQAAPHKARPRPEARFRREDEAQALEQSWDDPRDADEFGGEPALSYLAPGVQTRVLRKLRRGQIRVQAVLDLHGATQREAHGAVANFLTDAVARDLNCVRIIHGKGHRSGPAGPVLKVAVARWLTRRTEVLAYCSARPVDGGTGAVYVLLKRGGLNQRTEGNGGS